MNISKVSIPTYSNQRYNKIQTSTNVISQNREAIQNPALTQALRAQTMANVSFRGLNLDNASKLLDFVLKLKSSEVSSEEYARINEILDKPSLSLNEKIERLSDISKKFGSAPQQKGSAEMEVRPANSTSSIDRRTDLTLSNVKEVNDYLTQIREYYLRSNTEIKSSPYKFDAPKSTIEGDRIYKEMKSQGLSPRQMFGRLARAADGNSIYDDILLKIINERSFDVNSRYDGGYNVNCNPLFILTTINKPYLLQEALKRRGADPNIINGSGDTLTPLYRAIDTNCIDCAYVLLKSSKLSKSEIERCKARSNRMTSKMRELFDAYPDIDKYLSDSINMINKILKKDIKTLDDVLLTPEVDVNFIDSNGNNILHVINYVEDKEKAIQLVINAVNRKVNVNRANFAGYTPIQLFLKDGKYELVTTLIDKGADLSVFKDELDNSFAHIVCSTASEENAMKLIDYAFEKGLDLDARNCAGVTIAINAVKAQRYKLLNYLINRGASINIQDNNGMTPLHYACILNDPKALEILMNNFASTTIKDNRGLVAKSYLKKPELIKFYSMFRTML